MSRSRTMVVKPKSPTVRKRHSEAKLKRLRISVNSALPGIEDESQVRLRPAREVAKRCIALFACVAATKGERRPNIVSWLRREKLWPAVSSEEARFLSSKRPSNRQIAAMSWRIEALGLLLWSLGIVRKLEFPDAYFLFDDARTFLPNANDVTRPFLTSAKLLSVSEILDASDFLYRLHWACRDAFLEEKKAPAAIDYGIVAERHYAVNWLTRYGNLEWDDVTTDT